MEVEIMVMVVEILGCRQDLVMKINISDEYRMGRPHCKARAW